MPGTQTAQPADRRQPARQLDLARVRRPGARHRHRAAAGAAYLVRARASCRRRGGRDDGGAAVPGAVCSSPSTGVGAAWRRRREIADRRLRAHAAREAAAARDRLHCAAAAATSTIAECGSDTCATSHKMRSELAALVDQGKTHDEIIQAFVATVRQPGDARRADRRGLQPPGVARSRTSSARAASSSSGFAAVRWSRRHAADDVRRRRAVADPAARRTPRR